MPLSLNMAQEWALHQDLMQRAIQAIPDSIYTPAQKTAWIKRAMSINWSERMASQQVFEKKEDGELLAFASLDTNNLDFLFVSPSYWRKGLAASLIRDLEQYARLQGFTEITVESSLMLFPLCVREGFYVQEKETVALGTEQLSRFRMKKPLTNLRHRSRCLWSTERLFLRELLPIDDQTCFELNLDPEVMRYTGDLPFDSVAASHDFLESYDPYEKTGFGRWAMIRKEDGSWLGWCGIKKQEGGKVDLGYRLHQRYWNQGYATEAAKLSIELAQNKFQLKELILEANKDNQASRKVAEKLGFSLYDSPEHAAINDVLYLKNLRE